MRALQDALYIPLLVRRRGLSPKAGKHVKNGPYDSGQDGIVGEPIIRPSDCEIELPQHGSFFSTWP